MKLYHLIIQPAMHAPSAFQWQVTETTDGTGFNDTTTVIAAGYTTGDAFVCRTTHTEVFEFDARYQFEEVRGKLTYMMEQG